MSIYGRQARSPVAVAPLSGVAARVASLVFVVLLTGCGTEGPAAVSTDVATSAAPSFGEPCAATTCAAGLTCLSGDWAPEPWCSAACSTPGDYCDVLDDSGRQGFCIALPGDFKGSVKSFCAPVCTNTDMCTTVWPGWSKCTKPAWKKIVLYPGLPTQVCSSPGSQGQVVIDPVVCDWEAKVTDPKFTNPKQVCKAYCAFLKTCQLWSVAKEKLDCCTWRCFQEMTPGGKVDDTVEDKKKCYIKAFNGAQGTPKVCTLYAEQCDAIGDPHAP